MGLRLQPSIQTQSFSVNCAGHCLMEHSAYQECSAAIEMTGCGLWLMFTAERPSALGIVMVRYHCEMTRSGDDSLKEAKLKPHDRLFYL